MYAVYQLQGFEDFIDDEWVKAGRAHEEDNSARVLDGLDSFITPNGAIDVARMMTEWFPIELADVFISHTRADKEIALTLSGLLSQEFGLKPFVDSCVWSHANHLLRALDEVHCKTGPNLFSYENSIVTASHVHMMLASALTQMMDQCECVFFLNTANSSGSVSVKALARSNGGSITHSPWLFHEISMMKMLRRKKKEDHRHGHIKRADFSESVTRLPLFNYPINLDGIPVMETEDLENWHACWSNNQEQDKHSLDFLYHKKSPHQND